MPLIPDNLLSEAPLDESSSIPQAEVEETVTTPAIKEAWSLYEQHLRKWFYNPDIEAARIVLAVAASHFHKDCDPIWLFVIGPSSGDKTSICIYSLLALPQVHLMGDITAKTFLSGYTGTAHPSLLHRIGASGILAFKDFTTFISKKEEDKAEIISQFREIYDGSFNKETGKGMTIAWKGKLTCIAAVTPAIEREWATKRDLGERFLQVRISRKDGLAQAEFAQRQRGYEEFITTQTKELARAFFQAADPITNPPPRLSNSQMSRVAAMAELVSHCRGSVSRHRITNAITDLPSIENSGRMSKALASLISNHAALFRRKEVAEVDMRVGKRVALNSIPSTRCLVIDTIASYPSGIATDMLQLKIGLPESTIGTLVEDLEALGVLKVQHNNVLANQISLNPQALKWTQAAFVPLAGMTEPQPQAATAAVQRVQ